MSHHVMQTLAARAPSPTNAPLVDAAAGFGEQHIHRRWWDHSCNCERTETQTLYYLPPSSSSSSSTSICTTSTQTEFLPTTLPPPTTETLISTATATATATLTVAPPPTPVTMTATQVVFQTQFRNCCRRPSSATPAWKRSMATPKPPDLWTRAKVTPVPGFAKRQDADGDAPVVATVTVTTQATTTVWNPMPYEEGCEVYCDDEDRDDKPEWGKGQKESQGASAVCKCIVAWVTLLYGGVPSQSRDFYFSLIMFALFMVLFLIAAQRFRQWARVDKYIFFNLLPLLIFLLLMVIAMPLRAWVANNRPTTGHVLAEHVLLIIALPIIVDPALQLLGLLSRRAQPGGYLDAGSLALRVLNVATLIICCVAGSTLASWVDDWKDGNASCTGKRELVELPLVATILEAIIVISAILLLILARLRSKLEGQVLLHQILIFVFLLLHIIYRLRRDFHALSVYNLGWDQWQPSKSWSSTGPQGACWGVKANGDMDWNALRQIRQGADSSAQFWLTGIVTLVLATLGLLAANLPAYTNSTPPPAAQPDSARYQICYNTADAKPHFKRVDDASAKTAPDGSPLYELVRGDDGDWVVRESDLVPNAGLNPLTYTPWYR